MRLVRERESRGCGRWGACKTHLSGSPRALRPRSRTRVRRRPALLKQVWVGWSRLGWPAELGCWRTSGSELRRRFTAGLGTRAVACCDLGRGSYGTTGASTRCARPPLRSGPSDDTPAVPPLREPLWALRPGLDGGVPAVDDFTPDARRAVGAWALDVRVRRRSRGRERGVSWLGRQFELGPTPPTPVSGDSEDPSVGDHEKVSVSDSGSSGVILGLLTAGCRVNGYGTCVGGCAAAG